ncbi:hypothetical protein [Clostridium sp. D33t1_170424_F3]|uniref:hypothetical protein n=1 Tax=Clostridium sp. D33t1_170424_F3 TaxID=2787099 RepID=UPI0018AA3AA5|nr:hypothetical protein [Clostridium sp. D33t1_170424_F3]
MQDNEKFTLAALAEGAQHLAEAMGAAGLIADEAASNIQAALKAMQEAERESEPREGFPRPPRSLLLSRPAPPRTIRPTARAHLKQHDRKRGIQDV